MNHAENSQIYLLSSVLVWLIMILLLTGAKYPVWYPYYGSWSITISVEILLILLGHPAGHPRSIFGFLALSLQLGRLILLVTLFGIYLLPRIGQQGHRSNDEERQALFRKKSDSKCSDSTEDHAKVDIDYGTTAIAAECEESDVASDVGSEDSWIAGRKKASKRAAERLKNDGNWWTYAKGFSVSMPKILDTFVVKLVWWLTLGRFSSR